MNPRALPRPLAAIAFATAGVCSCTIENTVTFRFDEVGTDVAGFNCTLDEPMRGNPRMPPTLLTSRANAVGVYSIVFDFLPVDPTAPLSSPLRLFNWCMSNSCTPTPSLRFCRTLSPSTLAANGSIAPALASLAGQVILPTAPTGYVMVRAVAVATNCAALEPTDAGLPGFTPGLTNLLMGCAFSPVVDLNNIRNGSVTLSLPTIDQHCEISVRTCASL